MKIIFNLFLLIGMSSLYAQHGPILPNPEIPPIQLPPCLNGNAEFNSHAGWVTLTGASLNPTNYGVFTPAFDASRFGVHGTGTTYNPSGGSNPMIVNGKDRYGNFTIPSEGTYCFSLGNNSSNTQAEMMRYTFVVTNANKNFKLRYAVVVQDGEHPLGENAGAFFYMVKGAKQVPDPSVDLAIYTLTNRQYIADLSNPFYKTSSVDPTVVYKDWQCLEYDLTPYLGQQVSFVAMSRDCTNGAHWGYMYIDGLCQSWPAIANMTLNGTTFCEEQTIMMDGSASVGEDRYFLEVAEADAAGNYLPNGIAVNNWFQGSAAPNNINISAYFQSKGYKFKCGKRYRIKLAVINECSPWNETTKFVQIVCPTFSAASDVTKCCGGEATVTDPILLGGQPVPGNTYSWTSIPSGFTSNTINPYVNPTSNIAYIGTMTMPNGCIARDTVVFRFMPSNYTLTLTQHYPVCQYFPTVKANLTGINCPTNAAFNAAFPSTPEIQWFFKAAGTTNYVFLGTGAQMNAPNTDGTMKAQYTSPCMGTLSVSATTAIWRRPNENTLIAPNTFTPDGGQYNNVFRILEFGTWAPQNVGEGPAYGIEDFKLRIWNRWGENFRTIQKYDVGREPEDYVRQGDISWDGYDRNANSGGTPELVQNNTTYVYTLEMKYCGSSEFVRIKTPNAENDICVRWLPPFHICIKRISGWASHVNVIY